jgi:hypothetical protein
MDIVYASLSRRLAAGQPPPGESAEVLGALWAHATADDGLEFVTCSPEADRVDLLLFLLTRPADPPGDASPLHRAHALLDRSHQASPLLHARYLPPHPAAA